jgi:hypothetical protein
MESLKVMEKYDGANFHLWKFKMCKMLLNMGFGKFVDGSATLPYWKQVENKQEMEHSRFMK